MHLFEASTINLFTPNKIKYPTNSSLQGFTTRQSTRDQKLQLYRRMDNTLTVVQLQKPIILRKAYHCSLLDKFKDRSLRNLFLISTSVEDLKCEDLARHIYSIITTSEPSSITLSLLLYYTLTINNYFFHIISSNRYTLILLTIQILFQLISHIQDLP